MAFAVNKVSLKYYNKCNKKIFFNYSQYKFSICVAQANSNEIVLASTHDVQELDISALLAAQSFIWIGEEYDRESKRQDSFFVVILRVLDYCEAAYIIPV